MSKQTCLDAAYEVLREAGEALRVEELTRRMLEKGIWETNGKTPAATVSARLGEDINRKGEASRFTRVGRGTFASSGDGRRSWPGAKRAKS